MAITKEQKQEIIGQLTDKFIKIKGGVIVDPTGLKVNEIQGIRSDLKEKNVTFKVIKKSLIKLAAKKANLSLPDEAYTGSLALAISTDSEINPAKIIFENTKKYKNLKIIGGVFDKKYILPAKVEKLALIPEREILYAQLTGSIAAPLSEFMKVLKATPFGLINVLNAYKNKNY